MSDYYSNKLFASHLKQCYDIAPARIQQYLKAEVQFVLDHLAQTDQILELGCGYGRVLAQIAPKVLRAYGIDISVKNLELGKEYLSHLSNIELFEMNATSMKFDDNSFDHTIAIQNGISAFKVDPVDLIKESLRVTKIGGKVFMSSYSKNIWEDRLEW
ncbi:MAG: class I SAM-dependent methyltransferase, partial [Candidatus Kariarchaeaceae archaeon]